jgi:hypothetical protein
MAVTNKLELKLGIPEFATPAGVADQWKEDMVINATRINTKRLARVGSEEDFSEVIATPSSAAFAPVIDSAFVSKSGKTSAQIVTNQRVNLARSFAKYNDKLDFQFADEGLVKCKRFAEVVAMAKDGFSAGLAARTLRITGAKEAGLGIAGMAPMFLAGEALAESYLRGCDNLVSGAAVMISDIALRAAFKAALAGKLVYSGIEWIKNDFSPAMAVLMNVELDLLMNAFIDPAVCDPSLYSGAVTYCKWEDDGVLGHILHVKIGLTVV